MSKVEPFNLSIKDVPTSALLATLAYGATMPLPKLTLTPMIPSQSIVTPLVNPPHAPAKTNYRSGFVNTDSSSLSDTNTGSEEEVLFPSRKGHPVNVRAQKVSRPAITDSDIENALDY